jgi:hypothetical protein
MSDHKFCIKCGRTMIYPRRTEHSYTCVVCTMDPEFLDPRRLEAKTEATFHGVERAALRFAVMSDDTFGVEVWTELLT